MKRLVWILAGLALLAATPAFGFVITNYATQMDIQPDSSIFVSESITADFTGDPHHGIYRDLPLTTRDKFGNNYRLRFHIQSVTDENGSNLKYRLTSGGGGVRIKIGDPKTLVEGPHTYVIRYTLLRAVHFFDEHDELYWNVVGPEWEVPIEKATCVVSLPKDVPGQELRVASYTGVEFGSYVTIGAQKKIFSHHGVLPYAMVHFVL